VNNLPRLVVRSRALAGSRTRDLLIASPTPYRCATTPPTVSAQLSLADLAPLAARASLISTAAVCGAFTATNERDASASTLALNAMS